MAIHQVAGSSTMQYSDPMKAYPLLCGDAGQPHLPRGDACQKISMLLGRVGADDPQHYFRGEATDLPVLPGLTVTTFGKVSLPLSEDQMQRLRPLCTEQQHNVWTLDPDRVQMANPAWEPGIQKLAAFCQGRLGFKPMELRPVLSKVTVLGPGGLINRHQDSADDGREVAKMMVQLPSEYSGGNLVVSGKRQPICYDMSKYNDIAAFKPQYMVFPADANYAVESVTSGYCVIVEYRLRLSTDRLTFGDNQPSGILSTQIAFAMLELEGERGQAPLEDADNSRFALMLSNIKSLHIEKRGVEALTGLDCERFQLLRGANAHLPSEKQLDFFIAGLRYVHPQKLGERQVIASWYFPDGETLADGISIEWNKQLNFLNPDQKPFNHLWNRIHEPYFSVCERFALVAWPISTDIVKTLNLMGEFATLATVLASDPIDTTRLRQVFNHVAEKEKAGSSIVQTYTTVSLTFCQKLGNAIIDMGAVDLISEFAMKYFPRVNKRSELLPLFAAFIRKFGWDAVNTSLFFAVDSLPSNDIRVGSLLALADELYDVPVALAAVMESIIQIVPLVKKLRPNSVAFTSQLSGVWKHAMACEDQQLFGKVGELFKPVGPQYLSPVVDVLLGSIGESSPPEHRAALLSAATRRRDWLTAEIAEMTKPFAWAILDYDIADAAAIQQFLEGHHTALEIRGFHNIADARVRAKQLAGKIKGPLEFTTDGSSKNSLVRITKVGGTFVMGTEKMNQCQEELRRLTSYLDHDSNTPVGKKRPQEEKLPGAAA